MTVQYAAGIASVEPDTRRNVMGKKSTFMFAVLIAFGIGLAAQDLKVVVPQVSPAAIETYSKAIQAIADAGGKTITIQVLPFARAVYMMETKQADIEATIVQIPDKAKWPALKYDYSSAELVKIVFVLYTNKAKPISIAELRSGNPKGYKIETDTAHVDHFPFAAAPSTNIDASLKKVDSGDIDGFVFSQGTTDGVLKRLGLKNVARQYYDTFSGVLILQKGARGGPIDAMITAGLAKIKANGKYEQIVGPYAAGASKYIEWQP
jgi:polar amino acid transport system substrate-binding protein